MLNICVAGNIQTKGILVLETVLTTVTLCQYMNIKQIKWWFICKWDVHAVYLVEHILQIKLQPSISFIRYVSLYWVNYLQQKITIQCEPDAGTFIDYLLFSLVIFVQKRVQRVIGHENVSLISSESDLIGFMPSPQMNRANQTTTTK